MNKQKPYTPAERKARQRAKLKLWLTRIHGVSTGEALAMKMYREWLAAQSKT